MDDQLTGFMLQLFKDANLKGDELEKHFILYQAFYREIKPILDQANVDLDVRKILMAKFSQFEMEFEIICIKAYKPSLHSKSTARNIIDMYLNKLNQQNN